MERITTQSRVEKTIKKNLNNNTLYCVYVDFTNLIVRESVGSSFVDD